MDGEFVVFYTGRCRRVIVAIVFFFSFYLRVENRNLNSIYRYKYKVHGTYIRWQTHIIFIIAIYRRVECSVETTGRVYGRRLRFAATIFHNNITTYHKYTYVCSVLYLFQFVPHDLFHGYANACTRTNAPLIGASRYVPHSAKSRTIFLLLFWTSCRLLNFFFLNAFTNPAASTHSFCINQLVHL